MLLHQRIFLTSLLGPKYSNLQPKPRQGGIIKDAGKACTTPTITILGRVVLYADDAGIVSRSPGGLEKMMTVIVTACSEFGLMASEAKTEITCLQTK